MQDETFAYGFAQKSFVILQKNVCDFLFMMHFITWLFNIGASRLFLTSSLRPSVQEGAVLLDVLTRDVPRPCDGLWIFIFFPPPNPSVIFQMFITHVTPKQLLICHLLVGKNSSQLNFCLFFCLTLSFAYPALTPFFELPAGLSSGDLRRTKMRPYRHWNGQKSIGTINQQTSLNIDCSPQDGFGKHPSHLCWRLRSSDFPNDFLSWFEPFAVFCTVLLVVCVNTKNPSIFPLGWSRRVRCKNSCERFSWFLAARHFRILLERYVHASWLFSHDSRLVLSICLSGQEVFHETKMEAVQVVSGRKYESASLHCCFHSNPETE